MTEPVKKPEEQIKPTPEQPIPLEPPPVAERVRPPVKPSSGATVLKKKYGKNPTVEGRIPAEDGEKETIIIPPMGKAPTVQPPAEDSATLPPETIKIPPLGKAPAAQPLAKDDKAAVTPPPLPFSVAHDDDETIKTLNELKRFYKKSGDSKSITIYLDKKPLNGEEPTTLHRLIKKAFAESRLEEVTINVGWPNVYTFYKDGSVIDFLELGGRIMLKKDKFIDVREEIATRFGALDDKARADLGLRERRGFSPAAKVVGAVFALVVGAALWLSRDSKPQPTMNEIRGAVSPIDGIGPDGSYGAGAVEEVAPEASPVKVVQPATIQQQIGRYDDLPALAALAAEKSVEEPSVPQPVTQENPAPVQAPVQAEIVQPKPAAPAQAVTQVLPAEVVAEVGLTKEALKDMLKGHKEFAKFSQIIDKMNNWVDPKDMAGFRESLRDVPKEYASGIDKLGFVTATQAALDKNPVAK